MRYYDNNRGPQILKKFKLPTELVFDRSKWISGQFFSGYRPPGYCLLGALAIHSATEWQGNLEEFFTGYGAEFLIDWEEFVFVLGGRDATLIIASDRKDEETQIKILKTLGTTLTFIGEYPKEEVKSSIYVYESFSAPFET